MQPGQARVIGLILVLLALEVVLHPAIKTWLSGLITGWNTALNSAANPTPSQPTGNSSTQQCPPGQKWVPIPGGTTGKCM